jgi:hypothetical protein
MDDEGLRSVTARLPRGRFYGRHCVALRITNIINRKAWSIEWLLVAQHRFAGLVVPMLRRQ